MRAWWQRRSRRAKMRIVFYPSVVGGLAAYIGFATTMPGHSHVGPLPPLTETQAELGRALRADVERFASGPRDLPRALEKAAGEVQAAFIRAGFTPKRLPYDVEGREVANYEAVLAGTLAREIVVVGAHYDSVLGSPGADDNASGIAAMLAVARALAKHAPKRTVRFVAFVNEEPPHFWNPSMGSLVYARDCRARGDDIVAMLSLETLGYYTDTPGSQKYPPLVGAMYPDKGNFIGFIGNTSSRGLVRESLGAFRRAAAFPSEGAALPGFVTGVGWSDQWSFWQVGYPGVMVTDTAPFRNPHYHLVSDRPDTLDYERFARVVEGLVEVVRTVAR